MIWKFLFFLLTEAIVNPNSYTYEFQSRAQNTNKRKSYPEGLRLAYFLDRDMEHLEDVFEDARLMIEDEVSIRRLKVPLKLSGIAECGEDIEVPIEHRVKGLEADIVLYVKFADFNSGAACLVDKDFGVLAGYLYFNRDAFKVMDYLQALESIQIGTLSLLGIHNEFLRVFNGEERYDIYYDEQGLIVAKRTVDIHGKQKEFSKYEFGVNETYSNLIRREEDEIERIIYF